MNISDPMLNSIVRIQNPQGDTLGAGFIVDKNGIIVTCAHMIRGTQPVNKVDIVFQATDRSAVARVEALHEAEDIAILRLEGTLPKEVLLIRPGNSRDIERRSFKTFGYPKNLTEGLIGECEILGEVALKGNRVLQCRSSEVTYGYAGAPLWDAQSQTVIGMLTAHVATNNIGKHAGTVFVIPIERLQAVYAISDEVNQKRSLSWLHLADMQIRREEADIKTSLDQLSSDILAQTEKLGARPDFVVITGDIAFSGQAAEYRYAVEFLKDLLKRLQISQERLFVIPGNHDVDREAGVPSEQDNISGYVRSLRNYASFAKRLGVESRIEPDQPLYNRTVSIQDFQITLWGLNTAIVGDSSQEPTESQREYFVRQVQTIQQSIDPKHINIALLHHPLELLERWGLGPQVTVLQQNSDFILHAHLHQDDAARVQVVASGALVIQSGSDVFTKPHPNCYNLVKLDFDAGEGTIIFRRMIDGVWQEDTQNRPGGEYRFSLSERLRSLWLPESEHLPSSLVAGFAPEATIGEDQLDISGEVNAFSAVIAYKELQPPLCIGLFGDWGSGKTFFMNKMQERIAYLANQARKAEERSQDTTYCSHIVQISFNAWHYVDANLWACLVNRIFEGLDDFIVREHKEHQRKYLLQELKLATELRAEAECRKQAAEQHAEEIEAKLTTVRETRESKKMELRDVLSSLSLSKVLSSEQRDKLNELGRKLGLPQVYDNVETLDTALQATRTLGGRLHVALLAPENRGLGFVWLFVILVGIPLFGIGVNALLEWIGDFPDLITTVATVLTQIGAFAGAVAAALSTLLKRTTPIVDDLEKALADAQKRVQKRREEISGEEAALTAELSVLKEKETAAVLALEEARSRVEKAELAIQELEAAADTRQLTEFIQERVASREYKKHLGVISTIREDLETLSQKLREAHSTDRDKDLPCIDRIVLYIDDLDRCPEQRVVEVLQAVHLLLAFDLFVVVVGVDSRWLLRSLEETYPTLQINPHQRAGWSAEEIWAWQSTPQNYLEKIFQIPYNLRPMEVNGFKRLVESILPLPPVATAAPLPALPGETPTGEPSTVTLSPSDVSSAISGGQEGESDQAPPVIPPQEEELVDTGEPEIDLTPAILDIEKVERLFIAQLASLIPTPRAAKRFVNIYRLIRATISPANLPAFVGDEQNPGEHRALMVLLAILTGYPRQSPYIFRKLTSLPLSANWRTTLATFAPRHIPNAELPQYQNQVVPVMDTGEAGQWQRLVKTLLKLSDEATLPDKLEPYIKWAPQAARFSFRVGKITDGDSLAADVRITHIESNPPGRDVEGEYTRIENQGATAQRITGWKLSDKAHHTFEFPDFTLQPGATINVWVGQGTDSTTDLYWGRNAPVWNNDGDIAELRDANGVLIDTREVTPQPED